MQNIHLVLTLLNPVNDGGGYLQFPLQRPNGQNEPAATASTMWIDPLLNAPLNNGGHMPTMSLASSIPAINQANNLNTTRFDQRGISRYMDSDIGAYEISGPDDIFNNGFEQ